MRGGPHALDVLGDRAELPAVGGQRGLRAAALGESARPSPRSPGPGPPSRGRAGSSAARGAGGPWGHGHPPGRAGVREQVTDGVGHVLGVARAVGPLLGLGLHALDEGPVGGVRWGLGDPPVAAEDVGLVGPRLEEHHLHAEGRELGPPGLRHAAQGELGGVGAQAGRAMRPAMLETWMTQPRPWARMAGRAGRQGQAPKTFTSKTLRSPASGPPPGGRRGRCRRC